jgi:hypothetical protein
MFSVQKTLSTRAIPPATGATHLAALCDPAPTSIRTLSNNPPLRVWRYSGELGPSTVTGRAQLYLDADGFSSYRGEMREDGAMGHNYVFYMALVGVTDDNGRVPTFVNTGTVHGSLNIGSSNDSWQHDRQDRFMADKWPAVEASSVHSNLHVSTDPLDAFETVTASLLAAGVIVVITVILIMGASDGSTKCGPSGLHNDQGPEPAEFGCHNRTEFR